MSKAKHSEQLKGVYNLNPTSMVMKQGSEQERDELTKPARKVKNQSTMPLAHTASVDTSCTECDDMAHPMMQTRHSHPKNVKHTDGRKHEDEHYAVKKLKGMM